MPKINEIQAPEGYERIEVKKEPIKNTDAVETPEGYEKINSAELNLDYVPKKLQGTDLADDWPFLRKRFYDKGQLDLAVHLNEGDFRNAIQYHWGVSPNVAAKAYQMAQGKFPTKDILRNKDELFQWQEAGEIYKKLIGTTPIEENGEVRAKYKYPYTANWIKDPDKMAMAKDDIDVLTELEGIANRYNRPKIVSHLQAFKDGLKDLGVSATGVYQYIKQLKLDSENKYYQESKAIFENEELDPVLRMNAFQFIDPVKLKESEKRVKESQENIKKLRQSDFFKPTPLAREGGLNDLSYDFVRMLPQWLGMAGMSAATGFAGGMGFITSHIFGSSYADLTDAGVKADRAEQAAIANTTAQAIIETLPMSKLFSMFRTTGVKESIKKVFGYLMAEAGTEWLQEYPEMIANIWGTQEVKGLTDEETRNAMIEALPETTLRGMYSGLLGAMMGGFAGTLKLTYDVGRAINTRRNMEHFNAESEKIQESKLKDRAPEELDAFSNGVYETNNVSKELRIPVEKVREFYQDRPEDLKAFLEEMNLMDQYNEDSPTQELAIDRATFIRKYANTDFMEAIKGDVRFEVEGLTANETEALSKNISESLNSLQKVYAEQIRTNRIPPQAVDMWKGLTKKFNAEQAEANISVFMSMARQLATRRNETIEQWFDRVRPQLQISDRTFLDSEGNVSRSKKGSTTFTDSGAIINLYQSANVSTFLHEAFHVVTNDIDSYIKSGNADEFTKQQYNILVDYADGKLDTAGYEKLANAFEVYLREGKAPSVGLADAFRSIKTWMTNLYKNISRLNVKLNDDIRGVFDRLVASEQEINEVKEYYSTKQALQDLIPLPVEKKNKLVLEKENADRISIDNQVKKHMSAYMRAVGGRESFKNAADFQISKETVYQAIDYLKDNKLDYADIVNRVGEEGLTAIRKKHKGVISKKGTNGTSLVELVHLFDYPSEQAALEAILKAPKKETAINDRTKQLIKEREDAIRQELNKGESIVGEESYHHEAQLMFMISQAEILREQIELNEQKRVQRLETKVMRDAARDRIAEMPVWKAIRYKDFAAAERRFGQKAINLLHEGKLVEAHEALKMQAINHAMVLSSVEARMVREKIERRYKTKRISSNLKNVEYSFRQAAMDAINHYTLNTNIAGNGDWTLDNINTLSVELAQTIPAWILRKEQPQNFKSYRDLTMGQLNELDAAIRNIMTFGRDDLKDLRGYEYATSLALTSASIAKMSHVLDKKVHDINTKIGKRLTEAESVLANAKIVSFLLERADNYSYHLNQKEGPLRQLYSKVLDSEIKFGETKNKVLNALVPSLDTLTKALKRIEKENGATNNPFAVKQYDMLGVPLPESLMAKGVFKWTAERHLMFLLNLGNEQNRARLLGSYKYSPQQIDAITSKFTKNELKHIQKIWDTIERLYPDVNKAYFDLHNDNMNKVEASAISLLSKDGTRIVLRGGYFPLAYDYKVSDAMPNVDKKNAYATMDRDIMLDRKANVLRTKPNDRMTKNRAESNNSFIDLSYNVLFNHIEDSVRYVTHSRILRDFNKTISNPKWKSAFIKKEGDQKYRILKEWLADQANPRSKAHSKDLLEKILDHQRKLATINALGLNIPVSQKQRLSLHNAATEVGYGNLWGALREADLVSSVGGFRSGKLVDEVFNMSKFMKARDGAFDREFADFKYKNRPDVNTFEAYGTEWTWKDVQDATFSWVQMMDRATAVVVWKAAFNKYADMHPNFETKDAVKYADYVVETTQPISLPPTLNAYMRSDGPLRLFTSFMTFTSLLTNRLAFYVNAYKDGKITKKQMMVQAFNEAILPRFTMTLFGMLLAGQELPEWYELFLWAAESYTGGYPLLNQAPSIYRYKKELGVSPAFEGARKIGKAAWSTKKSLAGDKAWMETTMDLGEALELQAGVPAIKFIKSVNKMYKDATRQNK